MNEHIINQQFLCRYLCKLRYARRNLSKSKKRGRNLFNPQLRKQECIMNFKGGICHCETCKQLLIRNRVSTIENWKSKFGMKSFKETIFYYQIVFQFMYCIIKLYVFIIKLYMFIVTYWWNFLIVTSYMYHAI